MEFSDLLFLEKMKITAIAAVTKRLCSAKSDFMQSTVRHVIYITEKRT